MAGGASLRVSLVVAVLFVSCTLGSSIPVMQHSKELPTNTLVRTKRSTGRPLAESWLQSYDISLDRLESIRQHLARIKEVADAARKTYDTAFGDDCESYIDYKGYHPEQKCNSISFCCGDCSNRYCCSHFFNEFPEEQQRLCFVKGSIGTFIAVGVTIFVLFVIGIIICFTCSCCCLYKACRSPPPPRPIVTTTTTTVQVPYPQQPAVPQSYQSGPYQGYQPIPVHPGMPASPYPAQYPVGYPQQVPGPPPPYQEAVLTTSGMPYPVAPTNPSAPVPPPYNPAFVDPQKPTY